MRDQEDLEGEDEDNPNELPNNSTPAVGKTETPIWSYFSKTDSGDGGVCKTCFKVLKMKTGSTTSLHRHLKLHSSVYNRFEKSQLAVTIERKEKQERLNTRLPGAALKQTSITDCFNQPKKWPSSHNKAVGLTTSIAQWIAANMHPYSVVDEPKFREMFNKAEPQYQVPCRTTFSRTIIPNLYAETKQSIQSKIDEALTSGKLRSISITTDMWSSKSNQSYLAVTCHFTSCVDFQIENYCLGNIYFPEDHTGLEISHKIKSLLTEWKLQDSKIPIFAVTDNARNMVLGIMNTSWTHVSCFAHSLQLTISDGIKNTDGLEKMLAKARAIVGHFKRSPQATEKLQELQKRLGETPHKLIQDCPTRWNSQYSMLERLVEHKESISAASVDDDRLTSLSAQQWSMAAAYVQLLQPFDEATTTISSETLPTMSAVIPIINGLQSFLTDFIVKDSPGKPFARALLLSIKSRFPFYLRVENSYKMLAMMIDPRYKTAILPPCDQQRASVILIEEIKKSLPTHADQEIAGTSGLPSTSQGVSTTSSSLWAALSKHSNAQKNRLTENDAIQNEVQRYLSQPVENVNPCLWWKANVSSFPLMENVVRKYLSIPATEVASERVFSSAGIIVSERRQNLSHEHVQELVFLQNNLA